MLVEIDGAKPGSLLGESAKIENNSSGIYFEFLTFREFCRIGMPKFENNSLHLISIFYLL